MYFEFVIIDELAVLLTGTPYVASPTKLLSGILRQKQTLHKLVYGVPGQKLGLQGSKRVWNVLRLRNGVNCNGTDSDCL